MISFLITLIKLIILLGLLITMHEGGHFIVAKLCNVKVNEFAIGFGPVIWKKQGTETKYALRLIPIGGFVSMEGENEKSNNKRAFSNVSIPKRLAIVVAGASVNILFGIIVYFILMSSSGYYVLGIQGEDTFINHIMVGINETSKFLSEIGDSLKQIFTGHIQISQMTGPVGIGGVISKTTGIQDFLYLLSVISVSLGVTNLLPIPALDGGKVLILIIEAIRKKPMKQEIEAYIQLAGFAILIMLSIYVTINDISRL